jgi:hypothetical protein
MSNSVIFFQVNHSLKIILLIVKKFTEHKVKIHHPVHLNPAKKKKMHKLEMISFRHPAS